jgi:hypothetical protein
MEKLSLYYSAPWPVFFKIFPKNERIIIVTYVHESVYLCCANESVLADVSSAVPSGPEARAHLLRWSDFWLRCGRPPLPKDRESSYTERIVAVLFIIEVLVLVVKFILPGCYPEDAELHWAVPSGCSGCALLQSSPCHLLVRERHEQRPKGEAAKQRASEPPIFTLSDLRGSA